MATVDSARTEGNGGFMRAEMLLLVDQVTQVHWLSLLLEGPLCRAHAEKRRRLPTAPEKRKKLEEMASELSNSSGQRQKKR